MVNGAHNAPSSRPGHRHLDSDNAEQHNNHVQRDDGHEQDDENPRSGRDERQERSYVVMTPRSATSRMRPTTVPIMWAIDPGSRGEACGKASAVGECAD
jgi:hypothetical protein